jgi:hypothetical protein
MKTRECLYRWASTVREAGENTTEEKFTQCLNESQLDLACTESLMALLIVLNLLFIASGVYVWRGVENVYFKRCPQPHCTAQSTNT